MSTPTYLLTGASGLLGQCVAFELARAHRGQRFRLFCLGRDSETESFEARLRGAFASPSGAYLDEDEREGLDAALVPISADLLLPGLGLSSVDRDALSGAAIDHVMHVAALTDFRHTPHVAERLYAANVKGTERVVDLVRAFTRPPRAFSFVSSAYSCGMYFGDIAPDFFPPEPRFQNPYQRSKLDAEEVVRAAFESGPTRLRVFRPTVIGGRLDRNPLGFVTKFDVYLGWASFFLHMKRKALAPESFAALVSTELELPIRIAANPELGLNIVPADFVARAIVAAELSDHAGRDYHIAATEELPIGPMLDRMLESVGFSGHRYVDVVPDVRSELEAAYYDSAGLLYTPYISIAEPWSFDVTSLLDLCAHAGISPRGISTLESFDVMLEFAHREQWGIEW